MRCRRGESGHFPKDMKKIRCTWLERLKAETPDWGTCPACEKLKELLRQIYAPVPREP
jgi:hypothetical protein